VTIAYGDQVERWRQRDDAPRASRVLVVDDDVDLRSVLADELRAAGYAVIEARTGAEFLDHLADALFSGERAAQPDVIVSDIRLPGFFGLDILECLRHDRWRTGMIVMSAYADRETRERVARLGTSAFFEKPFEIDDLLAAVFDLNLGSR